MDNSQSFKFAGDRDNWSLAISRPLVEKGKALATLAHVNQTRKGSGAPYIVHPEAVARLLSGCDETTQAAGWLHDVVEDTKFTLDDIRRECGDDVANIVAEVTERKLDENGEKRAWILRKREAIAVVPALSQAAAEVRAADVISNFATVLEDLGTMGEVVWERFSANRTDSLWYYESMMLALIPRMQRLDLRFMLQGALMTLGALAADVRLARRSEWLPPT